MEPMMIASAIRRVTQRLAMEILVSQLITCRSPLLSAYLGNSSIPSDSEVRYRSGASPQIELGEP